MEQKNLVIYWYTYTYKLFQVTVKHRNWLHIPGEIYTEYKTYRKKKSSKLFLQSILFGGHDDTVILRSLHVYDEIDKMKTAGSRITWVGTAWFHLHGSFPSKYSTAL